MLRIETSYLRYMGKRNSLTDFPLPGLASLGPRLALRTVHGDAEVRFVKDLFRVSRRYLRSVHLEHDFCDPTSLNNYVITPSHRRVIFGDSLMPWNLGSTNRAWRITGDFGTGKSSFALVFAHLLREPMNPDLVHIRLAIEQFRELQALTRTRMLPLLVTGNRESHWYLLWREALVAYLRAVQER